MLVLDGMYVVFSFGMIFRHNHSKDTHAIKTFVQDDCISLK